MQGVELVDGAPGEDDGPVASGENRRRWWLLAAAVVVVLVLGIAQGVIRVRERAAFARLAAVPGVVAPVGDTLEVVRRYSMVDAQFAVGDAGGALLRAEDGSLTYRWGTADGPGWVAQLLGPVPALAGAEYVSTSSVCESDQQPGTAPADADRVVCLVTDGGSIVDPATSISVEVAPTRTEVVVLDTSDGAVLARWPATGAESLALLPGQVVLASTNDLDDVVTARELLTGGVRWTHDVPLPERLRGSGQLGTSMSLERVGDLVAVTSSSGQLQLVSAEGDVVRDAFGADHSTSWVARADPSDGDVTIGTQGSDGVLSTVLVDPGRVPGTDRTVDGQPVRVRVDDGSLPGLLVTVDRSLHAWDAPTGAPRWTSADSRSSQQVRMYTVVVRGRLYVLDDTGVIGLDGSTGETLWRLDAGRGLVARTLATDGRHLLVGYEPRASDGDPMLVAYDFATGDEVYRTPYPSGIVEVEVANRLLIGSGHVDRTGLGRADDDGPAVLG